MAGIKTIYRNSALSKDVSLRTFVGLLLDGNLTLVKETEEETKEFTEYAKKLAAGWVKAKNRATGRKPKVAKVINISKAQLDQAKAEVRKLWGPPPQRGASVHIRKAA